VFTARYAPSPYIKQIRFVFKGLKKKGNSTMSKHHSMVVYGLYGDIVLRGSLFQHYVGHRIQFLVRRPHSLWKLLYTKHISPKHCVNSQYITKSGFLGNLKHLFGLWKRATGIYNSLYYRICSSHVSVVRVLILLGLARTGVLNCRIFFTALMKRFVLNVSERTGGSFIAAFFQTRHVSFSGRCCGRSAVGGGNATRNNLTSCGHER
jgi:hypothetical protein